MVGGLGADFAFKILDMAKQKYKNRQQRNAGIANQALDSILSSAVALDSAPAGT